MNGVAFTVAQGREAGLTPARLRRRELQRPFRGMRVVGRNGRIDGGLIDRCGDLRVVLPPNVGETALELLRSLDGVEPRHDL